MNEAEKIPATGYTFILKLENLFRLPMGMK